MSINDDILYKIDSEIGKDKEVVKLKRDIERLSELVEKYDKELTHKTKQYEFLRHNKNIIDTCIEICKEHIEECRLELNSIIRGDDLNYINACSIEFEVIRKNIEMVIEKIENLRGENSEYR